MRAAQHNWQVIHGGRSQRSAVETELRILLDELDQPLMPGFMAAGYSALGRYLFLSTMRENRSVPPVA